MDMVTPQLNYYFQSFMNNIGWGVEHGTAATPDMVRQSLMSAARDQCADNPSGCPGGVIPTDSIESMVATYASALKVQVQQTGQAFESNQIANPVGLTPQEVASAVGLYYSNSTGPAAPSNVIEPELSPTSPAFTSPANVISTAPNSSVAGTSAGVGPGQGGSSTIQSPLNPAPGAGAQIASMAPNNMKLYMLLAAAFIVVLLLRK